MRYVLLALVLAGIDQGSKFWARDNLNFSENTGIAFSLPLPALVTIVLSVVVIGFLIYSLWLKKHPKLVQIAFVLVLAGAVGNLIDRVLWGAVTDFIAVYNFPVFNLADSFITTGVILYLWQEIIGSE